ncbi:SCO family protein [Candidatus Chloroploca sp. Khr17]|uniref:SCO family protein n=1 Tax=Candidatus Chloroploca sp. Khr17 TaxID=2496869 RepID=UPI001F0D078E|nr:SCO family protein [Candidatus Chloroploca sp. Khr17]
MTIYTPRFRWFSAMLLAIMLMLSLAPTVVQAQSGAHLLENISFEQRLGDKVPLDLPFVNEHGETVALGDYFGDLPVVLALGYYECPMLCSLVRNGMVDGLSDVRLTAGIDYHVVNVSIDPTETTMHAANTKAAIVSRYARPGSEEGWHFLTGTQDSIKQLADAVGFSYFYDETIDQYAHAAGILVLTPGGVLARYFYGIEYNASDLRLGLVEASGNKIGTPVDQLLLLCYHFDPSTGKYTGLVMTITRIAGTITVMFILGSIFFLSRSSQQRGAPPGSAASAD